MKRQPKQSPVCSNADRQYQFVFDDTLLEFADERHIHEQRSMIDTGCANPNWTAASARDAFFALGAFAMTECKLDRDNRSGLGGVPRKQGIAQRFYKYLQQRSHGGPGIELLTEIYKNGVRFLRPDVEEFIFEFTEGIVGCQYPHPVRMLPYCEKVVRAFMHQELRVGGIPLGDGCKLFATEGGTAAICHVLDSLLANGLLCRGDRVAIGVPALTSYAELLQSDKYGLQVVYITASGCSAGGIPDLQYPDSELDKLGDRSVKAFLAIDPGNPTSAMINGRGREYLAGIVRGRNPRLMIITDNVYGTFVHGFSSLMRDLPENTISIYSFSKYFGCTGWRLGVVAMHDDNIYDVMISQFPRAERERLAALYGTAADTPEQMKFIDRMAADSRNAKMGRAAGLSTPQQVQMALFAGFALVDRIKRRAAYRRDCNALLRRRHDLFWRGIGISVPANPDGACYYTLFDIGDWATGVHGLEFFAWLRKNIDPAHIVSRVAEECAVIIPNGGGSSCSEWTVLISFANLDSHEYEKLGRVLAAILSEYAEAYRMETVNEQGHSEERRRTIP